MGLWYAYIIKKGVTENVKLLPSNDWAAGSALRDSIRSNVTKEKKGGRGNFPSGNNSWTFFLFWSACVCSGWEGTWSSRNLVHQAVLALLIWLADDRGMESSCGLFIYQIYIECLVCVRDWLQDRRETVSKPIRPLPSRTCHCNGGETASRQACHTYKEKWKKSSETRCEGWGVGWLR